MPRTIPGSPFPPIAITTGPPIRTSCRCCPAGAVTWGSMGAAAPFPGTTAAWPCSSPAARPDARGSGLRDPKLEVEDADRGPVAEGRRFRLLLQLDHHAALVVVARRRQGGRGGERDDQAARRIGIEDTRRLDRR